MRRVGTLTSACTLLALGLLLFSDLLWSQHWFLSGLNYWPLVVAGLGAELVYSVYKIRRKRLPERLKLDGRSLGLLFLITVFSVNFYLSSTNVAEGAEEESTPPPTPTSLFSLTQKDYALPKQGVTLRPDSRQVVIQNPIGKVEVVGTEGRLMRIEGVAHVTGADDGMLQTQALALSPVVDFGTTMKVTVRQGGDGDDKADGRRVDLKLEVPKGMELIVRSDRGDVKVTNYDGNTSVVTKTGSVLVDKVTGALSANAQNGKVTVKNVTGRVGVNVQQGGVSINDVLGDVTVKSESGDCQVQNISGKLDFAGNYGKMGITSVEGDVSIRTNNGLVTVDDLEAAVTVTIQDGEFRMNSGHIEGAWTIAATNTKVSLSLPKDSDIKFLGETNKGVIKGPNKQSPGTGTKTGALITDQMGAGTHPLTVRSDNGSIFVDLHD